MAGNPERTSDLATVRDFYALVGDGQKADLIDGVIFMASPDTLRNDRLTGFLSRLLAGFAEAAGSGEVFGSRFAFILSPVRAPEPDVAFVRKERLGLVREHGMEGGPDIAVEIVSRDSRERDFVEKKRLYEAAGVAEYWLVDPVQRRAEFYRLLDASYQIVPLESNRIFRSTAAPGFYLDVEWLFADPLPRVRDKLDEILAAGR